MLFNFAGVFGKDIYGIKIGKTFTPQALWPVEYSCNMQACVSVCRCHPAEHMYLNK